MYLADVHGNPRAVSWVKREGRRYDSVIVGGDLSRGHPKEFAGEFLAGAASAGRRVFFVHGNWDDPKMAIPDGVVALHGKTDMLGKFSIGGIGGSNPTPFNGPFEMSDDEARSVLDGIGHVDILVAHSPPAGTKCDRATAGHIGSVPVREYVERERPALVLSGHVHEARSIDEVGRTTVVNPGALKDGNYAVVNLDGVVSVELKAEEEMS